MTFGRQTDEQDAFRQMDIARERAITFFDTAELYAVPPTPETYGKTEEIIGRWLTARGCRDEIFLASKIAGTGPRWIRDGKNRINQANIIAAVEGSLRRLQTDRIDLYQLHWPNRGSYHFGQVWDYAGGPGKTDTAIADITETLDTLQRFVERGTIGHIGLSNETAWGTMQYLAIARERGLPRVVSIQNEYNLLDRIFEPDLAEIALREQVGLLAWSPLATGMLTGKYCNGARPADSRWALDHRPPHRDTPQAARATERYLEIAEKYHIDPVHLALAFVDSRPFVTSTIIGARTSAQLEHMLPAFEMTLSDELLADIAAARRDMPIAY
jgi:aryl-alcohol dehydrogenase-like predicted oxidoreductase